MELDAAISLWADKAEKVEKALRHGPPRPLHKPFGNSAVNGAAAGTLLVTLSDNPSPGRIWNILTVGLFGADDHTSVAGANAVIYAGPAPELPTPAGTAPQSLLDAITGPVTIPSFVQFSTKVIWASPGEWVYAVVYNCPANQQVVLTCNVDEWAAGEMDTYTI